MPPKQLHLIRHAQGYHNLSPEHHNLRDPLLTPAGEQQCIELSASISDIHSIDCIVASASRRTLYTALVTFHAVLNAKPSLKIIALPELQETSMLACDVGASVDELRLEFAGKPVDLSHVHDGWNDKLSGPFTPLTSRVMGRCKKARRFLQRRSEDNVAVVSHGGLLHFLTDDWHDALSGCGTGWSNCELRSYQFDMSTNAAIANATIRETDSSLIRRMHSLNPLSRDEQIQLAVVAQASWAADGYIISAGATEAKDATLDDEDNGSGETDPAIDVCLMERRRDERGVEVDGKHAVRANL
ncbi:PGAM-domain-containing protein [Melanomma pulvis-pyrius CBS 109.77]|uniref:PGAM-domain-containing protein n=1 Tax=Melanomma pulvis-pyrius CBS 109.77 TaxID=1314802 RepID=A0A6A6X589_9PLEO|nr:PGAM-domain-containing protein [Melanomma pulvis-pyrius CBS 109.77]